MTTAGQMAARIRNSRDCAEFEFRGWSLLVLEYPECDPDRQVKVCEDPERPDEGAFWIDVDSHLEAELEQLRFVASLAPAAVPKGGGGDG